MKKSIVPFLLTFLLFACKEEKPKSTEQSSVLNYQSIVDEVKSNPEPLDADTNNIFDADKINPEKDSIQEVLQNIELALSTDSFVIKKLGIEDSGMLTVASAAELPDIKKAEKTSTDIKEIKPAEIAALKYNLEQLHNSPNEEAMKSNPCKQISCRVWAKVSKKQQLLYLHIDGKLVDSFKVSTGDTKHETPTFDMRPNGPIFTKYSSKKFPGGNYNGLGNMPYAVFIKGGYALHGTTKGNIPKLGKKASHGCVRLHPDNAKIFNELVKKAGLQNTWVTITND